jgi:hypothetical protein
MKKFVFLSLIALLIMGFSTAAYAQVEFKAYGMLNFGFIWDRNFASDSAPGVYNNITSYFTSPFMPPGSGRTYYIGPDTYTRTATAAPLPMTDTYGAWDKQASYMSSYANIFFEWNAGKEVKGVFNIETCNYHSGTNTIATNNLAYNQIQGAQFDTGLWDTRVGETRLRNAYLEFAVPYFGIPVPLTIRGGVIPIAVRPSFMFATTNGAGVQLDIKADPAAFTFVYGKMAEGKLVVADDSDYYSLEGRFNTGPATIGGYIIFQNMNTYPIVYNEAPYGDTYGGSNYDAKFWWFGGYADAKVGPVDLKFDLGFDTGKIEGIPSSQVVNPFTGVVSYLGIVDDVKYNGWATQVKATYPLEKFTFGGLLSYASGSDLKKTSRDGLPGKTVANISSGSVTSSKVSGWVFPAGDGQWVGWAESMFLGGYWSSLICIPQGLQGGNWNTMVSRGGTGGTWVAKLSATYPVTSIYKITLWGLYIGDTTTNGNTLGNAVKADGTPRDDKSIGWELSLINDIQIYKNLNWKVGAGILFAGDALEQNVAGTTTNKKPANPYMLSTVLTYNF